VVVKGVQFADHRVVGDIVDLALRYRDEGADELVFYDITASADGRSLDLAWVTRVAAVIDIPFSVAGGIRSVATARSVLCAGADKVGINSPAIERPKLLSELADAFGRQCIVLGIDSFRAPDGSLRVRQYSGRPEAMREAQLETLSWARQATKLGAGEIVLNCMNNDGVRAGYDVDQISALVAAVDVPVIASGGAGTAEHFVEAFRAGAGGALAASVFHDRLVSVAEVKSALSTAGIEVRR
jgi:cyclase